MDTNSRGDNRLDPEVLYLLFPENLPSDETKAGADVREALRIFAQATEPNVGIDERMCLLTQAIAALGPASVDIAAAPASCSGPKDSSIYDAYFLARRVIGRPDWVLTKALIEVIRDLLVDAQIGTRLDPTAWSHLLATTEVVSRLIEDPNDPWTEAWRP